MKLKLVFFFIYWNQVFVVVSLQLINVIDAFAAFGVLTAKSSFHFVRYNHHIVFNLQWSFRVNLIFSDAFIVYTWYTLRACTRILAFLLLNKVWMVTDISVQHSISLGFTIINATTSPFRLYSTVSKIEFDKWN